LELDKSHNFLNIFIDKISKISEISKFVYLGEKSFKIADESSSEKIENYFEVYCRCSVKNTCNPIELDFMFNDVTRSKYYQKQKMEFKYKTLFLSKVANEFKNPLISINELINQILSLNSHNIKNSDFVNKSSPQKNNKLYSKSIKILNKIKSISNYLIILVKDLDFFSMSQSDTNIPIVKKENNLDEVIEFCQEIAKSLLKKQNKSMAVKFIVEKSKDVPVTIFTDELRLKQVLVNLISNSIKFTLFGEIKLKISTDEKKSKLIYLISDTGTGINEQKQKHIFQPFSGQISVYNNMGAGLGLPIVKELTKKLGEPVEFISNPSGSKFWFSIPLINNESDQKENGSKLEEDVQKKCIKSFEQKDSNTINKDISFFPKSFEDQQTKLVDINFNTNDFLEKSSEEDSYSSAHLSENSNNEFKKQILTNNSHKTFCFKNSSIEISDFDKVSCSVHSSEINFKNKDNYTKSSNNKIKKSNRNNFTFTIQSILKNEVSFFKISGCLNFLVVDDEKITRMSTLRILKSSADQLKININFLEAEDGIECLYIFFNLISQGVRINAIISDETMNFLSGTWSCDIINKICTNKNLIKIPFYLLTAIESNLIENDGLDKIINKPLTLGIAESIIKETLNFLKNSVN
jgi:signal transduction histidine kinase